MLPRTVFVGVTSMTGEQLKYAIELVNLVKAMSPDTPVVFGGIHASLLPEQAAKTEGIDIVAIGEGEGIISEIIDYYEGRAALKDIKGICYVQGGETITAPARELMDLENLKTPSWHLIDIKNYMDFTVQGGRGCPHACTFCYNIKFNRRMWRFRRPESIIEEVKLLHLKYGVDSFHFIDDNFFTNFDRVEELCELIVKNNLNIRWKSSFRADYFQKLTPSFVDLLKNSGVRLLFVGGESGSPEILEKINKKISVEDIISTAEISKKYNLPTSISFMSGFPFETEEDRGMTYDLMDTIKKINPDISIEGTNVFTPYPGNELYEESIRCGLVEPESLSSWSTFVYNRSNLPWFSEAENRMIDNISFISRFVFWEKAIQERFLKIYYYPFYWLLRMSALVRWRLRIFKYAFEWDVFRMFRKKI